MTEDTIYVKCCVLANSLPDFEDEALVRKDVKLIMTNTKNLNYDIEHDNKFLDGIRPHENYINQSDEYIQDTLIPAGSWLQVLAITNKTLQQQLINKQKTGVSLRTELGENVVLYDSAKGRIPYKNIQNKEAMQPSTISFTDSPANGLPIEVMNNKEYTAKSRNKKKIKENNMTNNEETEVGFWRETFRNLFTAKNTATSTVPQATDMFGSVANGEEFMKSMIEANKAIPRQNELLEKMLESQAKSNEVVAKLGTDIEKLKLDFSEMQMKSGNGESKEQHEANEGQEGKQQQGSQEETSVLEDDEGDEGKEGKQQQSSQENPQDPKPPEPPKPQHTAKTSKPLRPTSNGYADSYEEYAMKFVAERSYENLLRNK